MPLFVNFDFRGWVSNDEHAVEVEHIVDDCLTVNVSPGVDGQRARLVGDSHHNL